MTEGKGPRNRRAVRWFPPSLAGQCLRYAVMDLLGFGRAIDPDGLLAMQAGAVLHRQFQAELKREYAESVAVEVRIRSEELGVSGRIDAIWHRTEGTAVIEYKTVHREKFDDLAETGPLVGHWAQLLLYLDVTGHPLGYLIVECRETGRRRTWRTGPDQAWQGWVRARIQWARAHQASRTLPAREVSQACRQCDRWRRCFASETEREQAILRHPVWEPSPPVPAVYPGVVQA